MIESILGILLIFWFAPGNELEQDLIIKAQHSQEHQELEVEQDEQSEEDCRYLSDLIPHRDLSDYVVLEQVSIESTDEEDTEQSEITEPRGSEQSEDVPDEPASARPHDEETD